ncbi:MAG: glycoside hydrolase family 3 protein, partial [Acidimicrobiales bacterium]
MESREHLSTPGALANQVVSKMTLRQELGFVALVGDKRFENVNWKLSDLCIPRLVLSDGPDGIIGRSGRSVQLPAAIGVAASFDSALSYDYGRLLGAEARQRGIDVVQAPELNLARVPESGRIFEAYGEDPMLTAAMGVAEIEGIQAEHVMSEAKHFTAYNQETARFRIDQEISARALHEIYDFPFEQAVARGHVSAIMCSLGSINGVGDCSDRRLYRSLSSWGFGGFVRSDLYALGDPAGAFRAGLDLVKPATVAELERLVALGQLPRPVLDRAVRAVLSEMFSYGLIAHPLRPRPKA